MIKLLVILFNMRQATSNSLFWYWTWIYFNNTVDNALGTS